MSCRFIHLPSPIPPPFLPLILVPTFALHPPTPQRHPRPRPDPCPHPHLAQVEVTLQSGGTKHKVTLAMLRNGRCALRPIA